MKTLPYFTSSYYIKGFFGDHRFLSNFHLSPIKGMLISGGVTQEKEFPSVENFYQFSKVKFLKLDESHANHFFTCSPKEARALGKILMSEADFAAWKMQRTTVMEKALNLKFRQNLQLRDALLETGEKYLEESNNWKDTYWGVSYSMSLSGQRSNLGDNWNKEGGKNMLGHLLMKLRETLYIEMNTI